jgi:hypothetical protein
MTLLLSPDSAFIDDMLLDSCTVEPYASLDNYAQPVYGTSYTAACRIESVQNKMVDAQGTLHVGKGTRIFFSASDPITSKSRVTLSSDYGVTGPFIVDVEIVKDLRGEVTHKVVRF